MAGAGSLKQCCMFWLVLAGLALLGPGGPAWALSGDEQSSPEGIEKRIEELKVFYKDDHPEVQRYKRALEKAREGEARSQTEKMKSERQKPGPTPDTPEDRLKEGGSFK